MTKLIKKLDKLTTKENTTEEEELERKDISLQLDEYYIQWIWRKLLL